MEWLLFCSENDSGVPMIWADFKAENNEGHTAYMVALNQRHEKAQLMLTTLGAEPW